MDQMLESDAGTMMHQLAQRRSIMMGEKQPSKPVIDFQDKTHSHCQIVFDFTTTTTNQQNGCSRARSQKV